MEDRIDSFIEYLKRQKLVAKYLYPYSWLSGCSTTVYPITIWQTSHRIVLQWSSDKRIFQKFIDRVVSENSDFIKDGYFHRSDGSCPSTITFHYKHNPLLEVKTSAPRTQERWRTC